MKRNKFSTSSLEKMIKKAGYKEVRNGKHRIFSNGKEHIALPYGQYCSNFVDKKIKKKLKGEQK